MDSFKNFIAKKWLDSQPSGEINLTACRVFAKTIANKEINLKHIRATIKRQILPYSHVYSEKLNKLVPGNVGMAEGVVFTTGDSEWEVMFAFDPEASDLLISVPGLLYDDEDVELLFGLIVHECQHAVDHVKEKLPIPNLTSMSSYLESQIEARAFHRQLVELIKSQLTLGITADEAIDTVWMLLQQGNPVLRLDPKLMPIARIFLDLVREENIVSEEKTSPKPIIAIAQMLANKIKAFDARLFLNGLAHLVHKE